jgi:phosphatidylinositol alpha-1,6-mannosyltransferase
MSDAAAGSEVAEPAPRAPGFPATVLALVDRGAPDDDVSYVGALLERALTELAPRFRTLTVFPDDEGASDATLLQRGMFAARLIGAGRRADCVVFNHLGVATALASLPAGMRRPYAVMLHGAESWDERLDAARRRALADATLRITTSAFAAARVREAHPEVPAAEVLPPALLPEREAGPVDGALVGSITPRTVVIAARMNAADRSKGHDELLEAWPAILGRRPDARLALVGRGDDVKRLEAKANGLGLAGSVRFTGMVTEATLDAMLARAGGFALPGRAESTGLAYLRAMRAGVPCIAGDADAARDIVEEGVTGMLVPAADRDALAQAVIALLGDSGRRRDMGDAGRARYEAHFTFDAFRQRLDALLRAGFPPRTAA